MRNDFYEGIYDDAYLAHGIRGWVKSGHKYIDRFFKNGRWHYIYQRIKGAMSSRPTTSSIKYNSYSPAKVTRKYQPKRSASGKSYVDPLASPIFSSSNNSKSSKSSKSSSKKSKTKKVKQPKTTKAKTKKEKKQTQSQQSSSQRAANTQQQATSQQLQTARSEAKTFNTYTNMKDITKNFKKYKNGASGYISAGNDKMYRWKKVNGKIMFTDFFDTARKLSEVEVLMAINASLKKKKQVIEKKLRK